MRNIFFSVVVITALVAATVSGTMADFSDSEEEMGDTLQAGSMDLKVNGADDPDVLPFHIRGMVPSKLYDVTKTVANMGTIDGWLYLHIKNVVTEEANDKDINGDGTIDELDKPEPERVAEQGGKHGQKQVPPLGERSDMNLHIDVEIFYDGVQVDLSAYDLNGDGIIKLDELECNQILIAPLERSGAVHEVNFVFHLQDVPEAFYDLDIFDETDIHERKWDHWPTNAYMGDILEFDILFELLQTDYEPPS